MKNWNKGRFGFWFYTKNSMHKRDAVMTRLMEAQGSRKERERILNLCRDLHIEKNQRAHIEKPSGVCNTCRAVALIKGENK